MIDLRNYALLADKQMPSEKSLHWFLSAFIGAGERKIHFKTYNPHNLGREWREPARLMPTVNTQISE